MNGFNNDEQTNPELATVYCRLFDNDKRSKFNGEFLE